MKSAMYLVEPDAGAGGVPGVGGLPGAGGFQLFGTGGYNSAGGAVTTGTNPFRGQGGSPTDARTTTAPPGAAAGRGSGGAGAAGGGGSGGSATVGAGGTTLLLPDAAPPRTDAREVAPPVGTPTIDPNNNYVTVNAGTVILNGTVASACAGTGSLCGGPTYTETSFCTSGTVGASPTYSSWANAGFTVNQASGTSGSTKSLPLLGSSITVSYSNKGGSILELQLWDGSNYWCSYLPPSVGPNTVTIPFSKLNTACWDMSGTTFVSGTPIDMVQFLIPCSATTPTPFDYCFLGLTLQ
jgi:hypothetical protein